MFVPLHRRSRGRLGRPQRGARVGAIIAAVLSTVAAAIVSSLADTSRPHDSGDYVVLGLLIAVVAVAGGYGVARMIGRHGSM